jgi:hypothetical protein
MRKQQVGQSREGFNLISTLPSSPVCPELCCATTEHLNLRCSGKEIPAHARMSRESLFRMLVKTRRADKLEEKGQLLLTCVRQALKAISELAAVFGMPFHQIQAELEQIEQEHLDRWPWSKKEDLDQARAEAAQRETVDVEDAFAAMAGVSREEWENRVEAHQRWKHGPEGE